MSTKMKVLLVQDVDKLGSAGEVKEVSGGYGRNYAMLAEIKQFESNLLVRAAQGR